MSSDTPSCKSILIVEDNEDIRDSLEEALKMEGYRAYSVKNGAEALEALKRMPGPALILLDMMMPGMDGWSFLEAQKQDHVLATLPVVVVSALTAARALSHGEQPTQAVGYLQKPVSIEPLLEIVEQHCEKTPAWHGGSAVEIDGADSELPHAS